jgi:hypothetical protein
MIPPRMLSNENEIFGTGKGLRNRVTACRKRIRFNRLQRALVNAEPDGRYLEPAPGKSALPSYLKDGPAVRSSVVQALDRETLQRVGEQEVGIT